MLTNVRQEGLPHAYGELPINLFYVGTGAIWALDVGEPRLTSREYRI